MDDGLQAEHNQLALRLAMSCTATLSEAGLFSEEFARVLAKELKRVAVLTEPHDEHLPLAAQMNSLALRLEGG